MCYGMQTINGTCVCINGGAVCTNDAAVYTNGDAVYSFIRVSACFFTCSFPRDCLNLISVSAESSFEDFPVR